MVFTLKKNHTLVKNLMDLNLKTFLNYFSLKVFSNILHCQQFINTSSYFMCNQIYLTVQNHCISVFSP